MTRSSSLPPRFPRLAALAASLFALPACVSSSLSTDVRDVTGILADRAPKGAARALAAGESWDDGAPVRLPEHPLTADDAVQLAFTNNREVWASLQELGIARGRAQQAGLLPNPEIDLGLRAPIDENQPLQGDIGLELKISEMLLVPAKQGVAQAELSAEKLRVAGEVLEIAYRARVSFHEVQARQRQLELRTRALESFQASYAVAVELSSSGGLPPLDLAMQKAAVEAARITTAEAELTLLDARERMNAALGLSGSATQWTVVPLADVPEKATLDTTASEKKAVASSLELAEMAQRMDAAARKAGLARTAGALPHLEGGLHGEHDGFGWEVGAHLTVGVPVFDRGQGTEAAARAEVRVLRERYVATATGLRAAVRTALNRVESAAGRARHYRDALIPARKKALTETVLQYNAMGVGVFRVLDVEREVTESAIAYTDTLLEYHVARAALDQLLAGRLRGVITTGAAAPRMTGGSAPAAGDAH